MKIFKAQPDAKDFVRQGEGPCSFVVNFIIPFRKRHTPAECRQILEYPASGSVMDIDTKWFLRRAARQDMDIAPDAVTASTAQRGA